MNLTFIYTPEFEHQAAGIFTDDELRQVELMLLNNPQAGVVVPGTGGVKKLRGAMSGRGKSGSARFIYIPCGLALAPLLPHALSKDSAFLVVIDRCSADARDNEWDQAGAAWWRITLAGRNSIWNARSSPH